MTFLVVIALLLLIAVLPFAGPLLEDGIEWFRHLFRRRGNRVHSPGDERVPQHSAHR